MFLVEFISLMILNSELILSETIFGQWEKLVIAGKRIQTNKVTQESYSKTVF